MDVAVKIEKLIVRHRRPTNYLCMKMNICGRFRVRVIESITFGIRERFLFK